MRKAAPSNGKVAKEAKECVQECASEFISFITSEASERCAQEKRKTVNGEDILFAMQNLGFDTYLESLIMYLKLCRENSPGKSPRDNNASVENDSNNMVQLQQQVVTSSFEDSSRHQPILP